MDMQGHINFTGTNVIQLISTQRINLHMYVATVSRLHDQMALPNVHISTPNVNVNLNMNQVEAYIFFPEKKNACNKNVMHVMKFRSLF